MISIQLLIVLLPIIGVIILVLMTKLAQSVWVGDTRKSVIIVAAIGILLSPFFISGYYGKRYLAKIIAEAFTEPDLALTDQGRRFAAPHDPASISIPEESKKEATNLSNSKVIDGLEGRAKPMWMEDHERNFRRAIGEEKPDHVEVLNSYYWRFWHFTLEDKYYLEIEANAEFLDWLTDPEMLMRKVAPGDSTYLLPPFGKRPEWFLTKSLDQYEIWVSKRDHDEDYRIYRDKENGRIYLFDHRV